MAIRGPVGPAGGDRLAECGHRLGGQGATAFGLAGVRDAEGEVAGDVAESGPVGEPQPLADAGGLGGVLVLALAHQVAGEPVEAVRDGDSESGCPGQPGRIDLQGRQRLAQPGQPVLGTAPRQRISPSIRSLSPQRRRKPGVSGHRARSRSAVVAALR